MSLDSAILEAARMERTQTPLQATVLRFEQLLDLARVELGANAFLALVEILTFRVSRLNFENWPSAVQASADAPTIEEWASGVVLMAELGAWDNVARLSIIRSGNAILGRPQ